MLDASPPPQEASSEHARLEPSDTLGAPPPSSTMPSPMKKRRMTVTGAPHALNLNIDVRVPPAEANSTPISPVVMGFTIQRDNPKEIEQVKSMISVKQKQKALIEQRRGSLAAPPAPSSNSGPPPPPVIENTSTAAAKQQQGQAGSFRGGIRPSPNGGAGTRRIATSSTATPNRPPSPNVSTFQTQQSMYMPHQSAQTLPPPPISFARRRAAQLGTKRKPADIVINSSSRGRHSPEQFQPSIQSAPPTQSAFARHQTMALPRLPNVMGPGAESSTAKRPIGNVPPTPTRLAQRMNNPPSIHVEGARSPMLSVPIAASLVPPTPAFHQTEHSGGDKAAFLAPFASFYESLNDAKQLKSWLGEQLQRSNTLFQNLSQQQDKLQETIENVVERKMSSTHSEIASLRRRVLELEDALRDAQNGRRGGADPPYHTKSLQNGYPSSSTHLSSDSYTFPPGSSDHSRLRSEMSTRVSSPRGHERDGRGGMQHDPERDSSVPYDGRRPTASALRLEPPRSHHEHSPLPPPAHSRLSMQSPPHMYRDSPPSHHALPPPPVPCKSSSRGLAERPSFSRQPSQGGCSNDRERERERERGEGMAPRRAGSRRNSIGMSPERMEES